MRRTTRQKLRYRFEQLGRHARAAMADYLVARVLNAGMYPEVDAAEVEIVVACETLENASRKFLSL